MDKKQSFQTVSCPAITSMSKSPSERIESYTTQQKPSVNRSHDVLVNRNIFFSERIFNNEIINSKKE